MTLSYSKLQMILHTLKRLWRHEVIDSCVLTCRKNTKFRFSFYVNAETIRQAFESNAHKHTVSGDHELLGFSFYVELKLTSEAFERTSARARR